MKKRLTRKISHVLTAVLLSVSLLSLPVYASIADAVVATTSQESAAADTLNIDDSSDEESRDYMEQFDEKDAKLLTRIHSPGTLLCWERLLKLIRRHWIS